MRTPPGKVKMIQGGKICLQVENGQEIYDKAMLAERFLGCKVAVEIWGDVETNGGEQITLSSPVKIEQIDGWPFVQIDYSNERVPVKPSDLLAALTYIYISVKKTEG